MKRLFSTSKSRLATLIGASAAAVVLALAPLPAMAGTYQPGRNYWHESMAADSQFDAVGQINIYDEKGDLAGVASGTLISPRWVLTAAHVVENAYSLDFEPGHYTGTTPWPLQPPDMGGGLYWQPGFSHSAQSWFTYPDWKGDDFFLSGSDIALVRLRSPITDIKPIHFARKYGFSGYDYDKSKPGFGGSEFGRIGTIVGQGTHGTGLTGEIGLDYDFGGKRRAGTNVIANELANRSILPVYLAADGKLHPTGNGISWYDFDADTGVSAGLTDSDGDPFPRNLEYMQAEGDSGGPIIVDGKIVGIVSGGNAASAFGSLAFDTRVIPYSRWIHRVMLKVASGDWSNPWSNYVLSNFWDPLLTPDLPGGGGDIKDLDLKYVPYLHLVPEPTTLSLLVAAGIGLGLIGGGRRSRRRRAIA